MRRESWESCRLDCLRANDDDDNVWENVSSLMRWRMLSIIKTVILFSPESWWRSLSSYIHHWEVKMNEKHFSLFRLRVASIDSSHFQTLLTPQSVLCASLFRFYSDEWLSVRSYLEPWEYPSAASSECPDKVSWCQWHRGLVWCQGCLMDGPHMGILHTEWLELRGQEILLFKSMECF